MGPGGRHGRRVSYPSDGAEIAAYRSEPPTPGAHPAVLLIHPVHGLIPFMEVLADRLAAQGYLALAPALYSRLGTITTDPSGGPTEAAWDLARQMPDQQVVADLRHALDYLAGLPTVGGGRVGAIGFCAGARYGLFLAAADPRLAALVAMHPTLTDEPPTLLRPTPVWDVIAGVHCPVHVAIGDRDQPTVEEYRDRLRHLLAVHGKEYEFHLYAGGRHGFAHEGSTSHQPAVAAAAWPPALDFLRHCLH
jgi:carboxymethylenebutenolidase